MSSIINLFHGSDHIVERPMFGKGWKNNDYGLGFYCTESVELAKEWAVDIDRDGYANQYSIDISSLRLLNLNDGNYHILNWLAILLDNRSFDINTPIAAEGKEYILSHFLPAYKDVDIVIGYRADDSYFSFASAFLNNIISLPVLEKAMMLGDLGEQIVVISLKAFERIRYIGSEISDSTKYYPLKKSRDDHARDEYDRLKNESTIKDIFILDIMREEWDDDDSRLRKTLS